MATTFRITVCPRPADTAAGGCVTMDGGVTGAATWKANVASAWFPFESVALTEIVVLPESAPGVSVSVEPESEAVATAELELVTVKAMTPGTPAAG